jgi:cell division protein FtsI (penicillin-binding protein 3)
MALDSGKVRINDQFDATTPIKIGKHKISDYHPENRWMNVAEIFEHSSNIGSAKMALTAGAAQQKAFLTRLGLLSPTTIELPEIGSPIMPQRWTDVTAMTVSFGYGISVSAIQLVRAVSGVVNGGTLPDATLLKRDERKQNPGARIMSEQTSQNMRQLMRLVVEAGTGKNADVEGYFVGGKTGTAEKSNTGGYAQKKLLSSFVGVFPMQNPQYAVLAVVDEPIGNKASYGFATAAWVAAPVVNRVVSRMAPILGLPPEIARSPMAAAGKPNINSPQYGNTTLRREAVYEAR